MNSVHSDERIMKKLNIEQNVSIAKIKCNAIDIKKILKNIGEFNKNMLKIIQKLLQKQKENIENLTVDGVIPPAVKAAMLLLVGNLYANREPVSYASVNKVPYTFDYLLSLYKNYSIL